MHGLSSRFEVALLLVLLATTSVFATNGAIQYTYGTKSLGRAGADTAVADDATSLARNPALICDLERLRGDLTLAFLNGRTRFKNPMNDHLTEGFDTAVPTLGIAWDPLTRLGSAAVDPDAHPSEYTDDAADEDVERVVPGAMFPGSAFRFGWCVFVVAGGGSGGTKLKTPVFPEGVKHGSSFFAIATGPVFGVRLHETLALGIQPQLLALNVESQGLLGATDGNSQGLVREHNDSAGNPLPGGPAPFPRPPQQQLTWSEVFDLAGTADSNSSTVQKVRGVQGAGYAANFGLAFRPHEKVTLGLSYQLEGRIPEATGEATIDANRSLTRLDPQLRTVLGNVLRVYLPDGGVGGLRTKYDFELNDFKTPAVLNFGVAVRPLDRWLVALDFRYIFWRSAFNRTPVTLTGGASRDINEINGSATLHTDNVAVWRDSPVGAIGTSFAANDWLVLRMGLTGGVNPINNEYESPSSGVSEAAAALGASFYVKGWDIDLAYLYALPNKESIDVSKSLSDLNGTEYEAEQHWVSLGVGYQF